MFTLIVALRIIPTAKSAVVAFFDNHYLVVKYTGVYFAKLCIEVCLYAGASIFAVLSGVAWHACDNVCVVCVCVCARAHLMHFV